MKAASIEKHGNLDEIKITNVNTPNIGPKEILVETKYAGLNHLDIFVTQGWPGLNLDFPHILGSDGSGIVKEIGSSVVKVEVGDKITINPGVGCGSCNFCLSGEQNLCKHFYIKGEHNNGTFAEYFTIPESNIFKIPEGYSLRKAAAAPLAFLTAWRMLVTKAQIRPGEFIFIQGGSGGVSTCAIQIAKLFNCQVITSTSSSEKADLLKKLDADHVINYNETPDYEKIVYKELTKKHGVDVVIDSVGEATFHKSIKMLKSGGRLVTCGATTGPFTKLNINQIFWKQLEILGSTMSNHSEFRTVMSHVFDGKLEAVIDKVFPFEKARDAEEYLNEGNQVGKILLEF